MLNKTTVIITTIIGILLAACGITLVSEALSQEIDSINLPIGAFTIILGITIIIGIYNEYTAQKDITCVKNSTQSKTSSNTSTADSTESNNSSNNEQ